jgi:DNA-nicking Smr family endonuclease
VTRKKTPRKPDADELALWRKVVEKATPMPRSLTKGAVENTATKPIAKKPKVPVEPFKMGQSARTDAIRHDLSLPVGDRLRVQTPNMDAKAFRQMKRGKLNPDARIDLHGMTLARAQTVLTGFLLSAQASGHRLVLVITGKGREGVDEGPIPTPRGILKHHVPQWLTSGALGHVVLQVTPAHQRHGGGGAYYVYLRRRR